jgi:hypothetical protein
MNREVQPNKADMLVFHYAAPRSHGEPLGNRPIGRMVSPNMKTGNYGHGFSMFYSPFLPGNLFPHWNGKAVQALRELYQRFHTRSFFDTEAHEQWSGDHPSFCILEFEPDTFARFDVGSARSAWMHAMGYKKKRLCNLL